jgi:hypothetical protein
MESNKPPSAGKPSMPSRSVPSNDTILFNSAFCAAIALEEGLTRLRSSFVMWGVFENTVSAILDVNALS